LPWKIGEIIVKNISHLDEFSKHFDNFKLREVPEISRFDPNDLFTAHMSVVDYGSSFVKTTQFKEGSGDNHNPMEAIPDKVHDDIDTLVNTNDQHKQKGQTVRSGNLNPNSPNVSQRSSSTKNQTQGSSLGQKNSHLGNSGDGGDENPPKENFGKTVDD
jgi:hypothetical protein